MKESPIIIIIPGSLVVFRSERGPRGINLSLEQVDAGRGCVSGCSTLLLEDVGTTTGEDLTFLRTRNYPFDVHPPEEEEP